VNAQVARVAPRNRLRGRFKLGAGARIVALVLVSYETAGGE
jgi:hypothetical protein